MLALEKSVEILLKKIIGKKKEKKKSCRMGENGRCDGPYLLSSTMVLPQDLSRYLRREWD
jgi:hypothetical protein